jgi:hypothetical protein
MRTPYFNRLVAELVGFSLKGYAFLGFLLLTGLHSIAQEAPIDLPFNPTVALITQSASVTENTGSTIELKITISAAQENAQYFGILLQGSDVISEDFVNQPHNIKIEAGATSGSVTVTINDDNLIEGTETVTASINMLPEGINRAAQSEATFKIEDNDFASIQLSGTETVMPEGNQPAQFSIKLDTGTLELRKNLVIDLSLDLGNVAIGTFGDSSSPLIPGQDFRVFPDQITFQAGTPNGDQRNVEVAFLSDSLIEGEEEATVSINSTSTTANPNLKQSHRLKIQDQNTPVIRFVTTETSIKEGATPQSIGVELDLGNNQLKIPLAFKLNPGQNDTAVGNFPANNNQSHDFQLAPIDLNYPAGSPNKTIVQFQVTALQDQLIEGNETANLAVTIGSTGFTQFSSPAVHTLQIQDANEATVQFEADRSEVAETDASINLNAVIETSGATLAVPLSFSVQHSNIGVAIGRIGPEATLNNADFDLPQNVFEFSQGDTDQTVRSISITPISDLLVEGTESATLELQVQAGPATVGTRARHEYIIADSNQATVAFTTTDAILNEGVENHSIHFTLNTAGSSLAVPVVIEVGDDGNSIAIGDFNGQGPAPINADYTIQNRTVTFPTGSGDNASLGFQVSTTRDQLIEGEEIGNIGISSVTGPATEGTANQFSLKIIDQNQASIAFQSPSSNVQEGTATPHSIVLQIDTGGAVLERAFSTPYSLSHQTTSAGTDFSPPANLTIEWQAQTGDSATKSINIPITDDSVLEPTESFEVQLQTPSTPSGIGGTSIHTVSIEDNDSAIIGLSPLRDTASEDGLAVEVAIVLSQVSSTDTEAVVTLGGTAVSTGTDLNRTIPAGQTRFDMVLFVVEDDIVEGPETVTLQLSSIVRGDPEIQIDTANQLKTITVIDNDSTNVTIFKQSDATEDQQAGEFKLQFSKAVNRALNFDLSLSGTATGNIDYSTPQLQLTMPANQTSLSIPIPVLPDNLDEPIETILASLTGNNLPALPITVQNGTTEMKLIDDDATPVATPDSGVNFSVSEDQTLTKSPSNGVLANDTDVDDGDGSPNLTASLDGAPPANALSFALQADGSFNYQPNPNFNGVDTFQYRASDGTNESSPALVTINVNAVNDPPANQVPPSQSVLEGERLQFTSANQNLITVTDPDIGNAPLSVSLSAAGPLTLGTTAGLQFTLGDGNSDTSMSFTANITDLNQSLNGLTYQTPVGTNPDSISLVTNDQGSSGAGGNQETRSVIPITIRPLNTPPQLTLPENFALSVTGGGSQTISPGLTVSDAENANLASARVAISSNYSPSQDTLSASSLPTEIRASFDSNTGELILQGPALLSSFQQALRQVTFGNSSTSPDTSTREITFSVNDGTAQSNTVSRRVEVSTPQFPPVISSVQSTSRTFTENGLPTSLLGSVSVSQGSAGQLTGATATIGSGFVAGEDTLRGGTSQGLSASFDSSTGTLSISGTASASAYASALGSVVYNNGSDSPKTNTRSISFLVEDSERSSNSVSVTLSVVSVNDSPRLQATSSTPIEFRQGSPGGTLFSSATIVDPDHSVLGAATAMIDSRFDPSQDQLSVSALPSGLSTSGFNIATGSLTIEGTASIGDYEAAIHSISYENITAFSTDRSPSVSLAVADPEGGSSNSVRQRLNLVGKSTPPEILGLKDFTFPEDTENISILFEVKDDRTPSDRIKLEIEVTEINDDLAELENGAAEMDDRFPKEGIELTRVKGSATLSLTPLPNAFGKTEIKITATDEQGLTTEVDFLLTLEGINDPTVVTVSPLAPLIFQDGSGPRPLFDEVTIKDPDKKELIGATLSFTSGYQPHQDSLSVQTEAPILASYDASTGVLNLTGKAMPKAYATTIQNIVYHNLSHLPAEFQRDLTLLVQDTPKTTSKPISVVIQVKDANLPPVGVSDQFSAGGDDSMTISFSQLLKNDSDPDNDDVSISLFNSRTQQGAPILVANDSIRVRSPAPNSTDQFFYTLTDRKGGYAAVRVTLSR